MSSVYDLFVIINCLLLCAHAAMYEEAMRRLKRLADQEYAYSTGCDEPEKRSQLTTRILAAGALKRNALSGVPSIKNFPILASRNSIDGNF